MYASCCLQTIRSRLKEKTSWATNLNGPKVSFQVVKTYNWGHTDSWSESKQTVGLHDKPPATRRAKNPSDSSKNKTFISLVCKIGRICNHMFVRCVMSCSPCSTSYAAQLINVPRTLTAKTKSFAPLSSQDTEVLNHFFSGCCSCVVTKIPLKMFSFYLPLLVSWLVTIPGNQIFACVCLACSGRQLYKHQIWVVFSLWTVTVHWLWEF